ncbi:MAG: 50S ribosomal protein L23 [Christensenellaceae bacterium]|jgi:large subunit ribosomal protein L23|nr:50S ribosomal protein L23 [Christensenellaceae bacterium]
MSLYDIIIKPILSEKSYAGIEGKKYAFKVLPSANKLQIKAAVETAFGVKVAKVNTVSVKGKRKRQGKTQGYTSDWKKAYVQLTADSKSIEFFDSLK